MPIASLKKKKSSPHFLAFSSLLELILNAKASFFLNLNVHVALNIVGLSKISFNYLFFFCYRGALDRELKRNETGVSYPLHIIRNSGLNIFGRYTKHVETQRERGTKISYVFCSIVGITVNMAYANMPIML